MFNLKGRRGSRLALALACWLIYMLAFIPLYRWQGLVAPALVTVPVLVVAWLFGARAGIFAGLVAFVLDVLLLDFIGEAGWQVMIQGAASSALLVLVGGVVGRLRDLSEQLQRELSRRQEVEEELKRHRDHLAELVEQRLVELSRRARYLEATAEVAGEVRSVLDLQKLLPRVVSSIAERFGYYHTAIFLLDEAGQYAVLRAASSEGGQRLLARGHRLPVGAKGIVSYVISRGEPYLAGDVSSDAVFLHNPDLPATRSELALPLRVGDKLLGVLDVQSKDANAFSHEEMTVLQTLADQVAVAVDNARLFAQVQTRVEELAVLNEMGRVLTMIPTVDDVLEHAYRLASRLIDTTNFYVALYDEEHNEVSFPLYVEGKQLHLHVSKRQLSNGLTEYVIRTRQPLLIEENVSQRVEELGIEPIGREAQSWLGVPMMIGERVIGVIAVQSYTTPRLYSTQHCELLMAIANQVAIAIENARLHEQAQRELAKRERAERELEERREYLETVLASAPDAIITLDAKHHVVEWNSGAEKLFGYTRDEAVGRHLDHLVANPDTFEEASSLTRVVRSGKYLPPMEAVRYRKDGSPVHVMLAGSSIVLGGELIGTIAVYADITDRKRVEEALRRKVNQLDALSRAARTVTASLNLDQVLAEIVSLATQISASDYASVVLMDESGHMGRSAENLPGALAIEHRIREGGVTDWIVHSRQAVVIDDIRADGTMIPELGEGAPRRANPVIVKAGLRSVAGLPLMVKDRLLGVLYLHSRQPNAFRELVPLLTAFANQVAIAIANARLHEQAQREIAERRRAEAELQTYAARLERSNRELESFAYIASHDLKEPLRKIQVFGERLVAKYGDVLDERGRDYLARMQNAATRMQALIDGLLVYSRVTTKAQPFVTVDLNAVVREVLDDLEVRIEQLQARVEVGELPTVEADPLQMRQLFQNLIGNALKFHREGVAPVVRVRSEPLNGSEGQYRIMVEDNGVGFDEKYADRLFQVFQRLHGRSEYEGTGIGLAICRKIIERHGGSITAQSAPDRGATFVVTLPLKQPRGRE